MLELFGLHWLRPAWLLGLIPVALVLLGLVQRHSTPSSWRRVIDAALLDHLLESQTAQRKRAPMWLAGVAWLLAVVALAGPSWHREPQPVSERSDSLVILLDLSLSMYANDVAPSRLIRAQHAISDLLQARKDGRTALVVYAGDAHIVTPLTDDVRTIANLLPQLQPAIMPLPGSNLADALIQASRLMKNAGAQRGRILAITDEVTTLGDVSDNVKAAFPLSVLGVGTAAGAPIPLDDLGRVGETLKDDAGNTVIAHMDADQLARAAQLGGGSYRTLSPTGDDAQTLLADTRAPDMHALAHRTFDVWSDQGFWLLLIVLPITALAFRRGTVVLLAIGVTFTATPPAAHAMTLRDLWQRSDQQAMAALRAGDADRAARLFTSSRWRATALYRGKKFAQAAKLFADDASADGEYNSGNALAKQGDIEGALAAYTRALAMQPTHADAAFNRDVLRRFQQKQKQQTARQPQSGTQQRSGGARSGQQDQSRTQQQDKAQQKPAGQSEQAPTPNHSAADQRNAQRGQQAQQAGQEKVTNAQQPAQQQAQRDADAQADEQRRATEQWLRRVPDDPGGLLRRKFTSESSARFLDHRAPPTQEKVW